MRASLPLLYTTYQKDFYMRLRVPLKRRNINKNDIRHHKDPDLILYTKGYADMHVH